VSHAVGNVLLAWTLYKNLFPRCTTCHTYPPCLFFLLVQGDIYEPSCEGHVSEAGVDGLEGRNSSIAPTRYQIKWISRKLDAISCTVLHQIVVESIQVVGVFDYLLSGTGYSQFIWLSTHAKTDYAFVNCDGSKVQWIRLALRTSSFIFQLYIYSHNVIVPASTVVAGNQTCCLTRLCWQLHSDFRPNVFRNSHWATGSWHSLFQAVAWPFAVPVQDRLKFKPSFVVILQQETRTSFVRTHAGAETWTEFSDWIRMQPGRRRSCLCIHTCNLSLLIQNQKDDQACQTYSNWELGSNEMGRRI